MSSVSLLFNVLRGNGDVPVTRVGLLLLVFAETGVASSDIQKGCITCKVAVSEFDTKGASPKCRGSWILLIWWYMST